MYCPEHKVLNIGGLWVWMYWRDVPRHTIPLRIWMNPLRYEVRLVIAGRRWFCINREGLWASRLPYALRSLIGSKT
jgi:hypothetical protein